MRNPLGLALVLIVSALPKPASADTLRVPKEFATVALAAAAAKDGDLVLVSPGTYTGQVSLNGKVGVTIRGTDRDGVMLRYENAFTIFPAIYAFNCARIRVENLTIDGAADRALFFQLINDVVVSNVRVLGSGPVGPIEMNFCDGVRLERVDVRGMAGPAAVFGSLSDPLPGKLEVLRCRFEDIGGDALTIYAPDVRIENCRFTNVAGNAIVLLNGQFIGDALVRKNRFVDCQLVGVKVDTFQAMTVIEQNQFVRGTTYGIWVSHARTAIVRNNRMTDTLGIGIEVDPADSLIEGNKLVRSGNVGILVGGLRTVAARNTVLDCKSLAMETYNQRVVFKDNVIKNPLDIGILIQGGSDACELEGNRVTGPTNNGIDVRSNDCSLVGNVVRGSQADGFAIGTVGNTLKRNTGRGSAGADLRADLQSNTVAASNRFGTVADV